PAGDQGHHLRRLGDGGTVPLRRRPRRRRRPGAAPRPGHPRVPMSRAQTYAQLVRLPNVPTALADICLGALAAGALPGRWLSFALLLPASACLYCAGMVWNDYFDVEQDRRERPSRPIPSGRMTRREAARL